MKKNMLSLVLSTALALPTIAMAAPNAVNNADLMPADMRSMPVDNTLQAEIEGPDGELLATQPGAVDDNDMDAMNAVDMAYEADDMDDDKPSAAKVQQRAAYGQMAQAKEAAARAEAEAQAHAAMMRNKQAINDIESSQVTPADMREQPVESTLQEKKKDRRGELLATQPGQVEFNENRRFTIR